MKYALPSITNIGALSPVESQYFQVLAVLPEFEIPLFSLFQNHGRTALPSALGSTVQQEHNTVHILVTVL